MAIPRPQGDQVPEFRLKKQKLRARLAHLPHDALPGSLSHSFRRCGKPTCHCAKGGQGHEAWKLIYMAEGKRRVEWIPAEWVDDVRWRVRQGQCLKEALAQYLTANAELLVLARRQRRR